MGTAMDPQTYRGEQSTRTVVVQDAQRSARMTIPMVVRESLGLEAGDVLLVRPLDDDKFVVKTSESVWCDGVE